MRSNKHYSNTNLTKRIKRSQDRFHPDRGMMEPAICQLCHAIYADRH